MDPAESDVTPRDTNRDEKSKKNHRSWLAPAGVAVAGLAGLALLLIRGCWHRKMSWPVRGQGYSYQVCMGCGVKRLFDEKNFRSYGPFKWELEELIAWDRARTGQPQPPAPEQHRSAS